MNQEGSGSSSRWSAVEVHNPSTTSIDLVLVELPLRPLQSSLYSIKSSSEPHVEEEEVLGESRARFP